ncbi:concentrative nucleoside transporter, CNT family [Trichlorobacter thiogenes]|uniref:Concentrative nucleoside transporter, CNT family n=1 Tax=Trichlorobacter thiogenes TaxID=115783 RepID=A0A1T4NKL1_9BACT|nr:nucleoside transporter C-terminal domain-containing protein [Trichlorobacter thiogenes]SJZ79810.1 concentrative nucleoside transporter, CNT family [Trichlorobacter thiogenes]
MLHGIFGITVLLCVAWLLSENRRMLHWRLILAGLALQLLIALLMLKAAPFRQLFMGLNTVVAAFEEATKAGTSFVFGYLGGGPLPFVETAPGGSFSLAFQALPMVLVIGALTAVLYYWRILPKVVQGFSWVLRKTMGIGGALGVVASGCIFLGMIESPLLIRPYLVRMTRSELFAMMATGLSCIAGTMLVLYATVLQKVIPDALGHILTASIIHAPAALVVASIMVPETQEQTLGGELSSYEATSAMDALTKGTWDGLKLLVNIVAVLIVFVALVKLVNIGLGQLPDVMGGPVTLERILGILLSPVVWLIGVPWSEAGTAGSLMGIKIVLNEFLAYIKFSSLPEAALSPKTRIIMTYAMCSFANLGSLGILIAGLGSLCPERRDEIVAMGVKALIAGVLASLMTGAVVGML